MEKERETGERERRDVNSQWLKKRTGQEPVASGQEAKEEVYTGRPKRHALR